jgi:hypothetical protein
MLENHRLGLKPLSNIKEKLIENGGSEFGMGLAPAM